MSATDVSDANILGERGLRYKRNTLAASLIATVLYWTDAPLGEVNFFGVGLSNVKDQEAVAWTVFLAILGYQWVMLTYYGCRDWSIWQQRIRQTFEISVWALAVWFREGSDMWRDGAPTGLTVSKISTGPDGYRWEARTADGRQSYSGGHFQHSHRANIRWRLTAFLTIEFGLPCLWGFGCLFIAMSKIFVWDL